MFSHVSKRWLLGIALLIFSLLAFEVFWFLIPRNVLDVGDQALGDSNIKVKLLSLKKPGFLVAQVAGIEAGRWYFYGHSDYLPPGIYKDINLELFLFDRLERLKLPKPGDEVLLTLFEDNGDTLFDPVLDKPVRVFAGRAFSKSIRLY